MKYYDNFLKHPLDANYLLNELKTIEDWEDFDRNNSHMKEYYGESQLINKTRQYLHSKKCIEWIEKESGIDGLVVDTYGTGEGVSLMEPKDYLDPHIDFDWNERIKLYRAVNLTIYLGSVTGGEFTVWDEDMKMVTFSKSPKHNSAILFSHSETKAHGVKPVISGQRYAIRQFYYRSEAICDNAHQSLYWYNPKKQMPTNS
jgi:hypothetical protein